MGKRAKTGPFDFPAGVEDAKVRAGAVALLKDKGCGCRPSPSWPSRPRIAADVREALARIGPDDAHPLNLYRVHWFNDLARSGASRHARCTSSCPRR